ncbi:MAG: hypothetical protein MUE77_11795 [Sandarakinorhabdus sp.]|jgi:hypothetical protein|nr:hypothetical protein [Sandarakinorhabdus sp.]
MPAEPGSIATKLLPLRERICHDGADMEQILRIFARIAGGFAVAVAGSLV